MKTIRVHNRKNLIHYRKKLRSRLTPAEAYLWKHLKAKKLDGRRFVKQHSIGRYIVDFYCASEQLIIELDGEIHLNATAESKDHLRTLYLNRLGFSVIRFENKMVFDNLDWVLDEIVSYFKFK